MSRSVGTGSPVFFRCSECRRDLHRDRFQGMHDSIELTGRTRPYEGKHRHSLGSRSTRISREYRCRDCGHVGWSNHVDLARTAGEHE